jgi:acyl-CoA thioesterase I
MVNLKIGVMLMLGLMSLAHSKEPVRYVALGDSYTIGTGAQLHESWPAVITRSLQNKKVPIELVANLARNGWTTKDVLDQELPALAAAKPDMVTLLIGTNDWVQGVDAGTFRNNFRRILAELTRIIPAKKVLVMTIPDFSVMPAGPQYSHGRDIAQGLTEFNRIIMEEAQQSSVDVFDLFSLSQSFAQDRSFAAEDGLHPSAKGYAVWAQALSPLIEHKVY